MSAVFTAGSHIQHTFIFSECLMDGWVNERGRDQVPWTEARLIREGFSDEFPLGRTLKDERHWPGENEGKGIPDI